MKRAFVGLAAVSSFGLAVADFDGPAPIAWRWADRIEARPSGTPIIQGDRVFAAVGSRMYCLERSSGNEVWRFPAGVPLQASFTTGAVVVGDVMIAAANDKAVYGVNTQTGEMVWQYVAPDTVYSRPVVAGNNVVFALSSNQLVAINAATGRPIWDEPYRPTATIYNSMVGWQGNVIFLTSDGMLTALDVSAKRPAWRPRQFTSVSPLAGLAVYGDTVIVTSGSYVTSMMASSGRVRWEQIVPGRLQYAAAAGPEGVVCVTDDGRMHTYSNGGRPAFRTGIDLGSGVAAAPIMTGNLAVVPLSGGTLKLVDPFSGQVVWNFTMPPMVKGTMISTGTSGGGGGAAGLGTGGGGGQAGDARGAGTGGGGTDDAIEVKYVTAVGPAVTEGDTLAILAEDGSIFAFDKNYGVDLTPPDATLGWPNPGDQVSGRAPMELVFLVNDAGSGVNYDSVGVTINGQKYVHEVDEDGRVRVKIISTSGMNKPLQNGRALITMAISDWMGNATSLNFVLTIDNTLPPLGSPKIERKDDGGLGTGGRGGRGGGAGG